MVRGGHNRKSARNEQMRADYVAGLSVMELVEKYDVKRQRVYQICLLYTSPSPRDS